MVLVKLTLAQGFRICVRKLNKKQAAVSITAGLFFIWGFLFRKSGNPFILCFPTYAQNNQYLPVPWYRTMAYNGYISRYSNPKRNIEGVF